jgi:hypothetical protein
MKSCEQITLDLLKKREVYQFERDKKKNMMIKSVSSMCCVAFVVLLGIAVYKGGALTVPDPIVGESVSEDSTVENTDRYVEDTTANIPDVTTGTDDEDKIVLYSIDSIPKPTMYIALMLDDFVNMTADELKEYYGVDIFPEPPTDLGLTVEKSDPFGIYKSGGGEGDIYHDANILRFVSEDDTKGFSICVAKEKLPFSFYLTEYDKEMMSVIKGYDVFIGVLGDGEIYCAEFMYSGAGFRAVSEGLTEDEFVSVIKSIIE